MKSSKVFTSWKNGANQQNMTFCKLELESFYKGSLEIRQKE